MGDSPKQFAEKIFSINASSSTAYSSVLSIGSRSNVMSDGSLIVNQLRSATAELTELIESKNADAKVLEEKAKFVEGCVLNLQVTGQISSDFCDSLLEDLHNMTDI